MKINRKKFFLTAVTSFLGIAFFKNLSFKRLGDMSKSDRHKIEVKINPSAVSRSSIKDYHA